MLREDKVPYEVDGVAMIGSLIVDDERSMPRPSVLVFGGGQVLDGETRQAARARMNLTGIARSAFDTLVARPECDSTRVATLGYCFGGAIAVNDRKSVDTSTDATRRADEPANDW